MARGLTTESSVIVNKLGQVQLTVPRALAAAMGMVKGRKVTWQVMGVGRLEISLIKDKK